MKRKQEHIIRKQLYETLHAREICLDFITALAGDRDLTPEEQHYFRNLQAKYGDRVYAEMLFVLTHQYFPEEICPCLWQNIVLHKEALEEILARPVGVSVASMDYLANINGQIEEPCVISKGKIAQIAEIALKDGLTHLFDVSTFHTKLEMEIKRYKRYGSEMSLIMIDIDDFKEVNDTRGHQVGDRVLRKVSRLIAKTARDLDICSRYGGEEFAVILPQTGRREALLLAERTRQRIEDYFKKGLQLTVSLGIATCPLDAESASMLITTADRALYLSKKEGKNRVSCCRSPG